MVKAGFPLDDPLLELVCEAYETSRVLRLELLAMAARGTGLPSNPGSALILR
jgi:hypothetical protein